MHLDDTDKRLLNAIQIDFPLSREPFSALGQQLGIDGEEVLRRLEQYKREGSIRQIGPVMDARRLGYRTTLVAMRLAENRFSQAAEVIKRHPGISHCYEREHHFNFWFTLALSSRAKVKTELQKLSRIIKPEATLELPALRLFKIGVYLDMTGDGQQKRGAGTTASNGLAPKADLSPVDRAVINELQQDLPLVPEPFDIMSARLAMDVEGFLSQCRSLLQRGIIRRFGAAINHNRLGFTANAMTCWVAPAAMVVEAGRRLASLPEVSHCYQRKTGPQWPYNLFAMIHGHTREACQMIADRESRDSGLKEYVLLFSVKEIKKARVKYIL